MTDTDQEVEDALAALERAAEGMERDRRERDWDEAMRFCEQCKSWVNRHMVADVVRVCPNANNCRVGELQMDRPIPKLRPSHHE